MWQNAESYERYIGRWSRHVARLFVPRLPVRPGAVWLEVGCGSGALTTAILDLAAPSRVIAADRSAEFALYTSRFADADGFIVADAVHLPVAARSADAVVSALVLNFIAQPEAALRDMLRCLRPGGTVAAYVWDYSEGMQPIRLFWDAAVALDPAAAGLDEGVLFPLCRPAALQALFVKAGAADVAVTDITIPAAFPDFDDLWSPFLGGQGPAPAYTMGLPDERRNALRERLRGIVRARPDGSIQLSARAWVARGVRPY